MKFRLFALAASVLSLGIALSAQEPGNPASQTPPPAPGAGPARGYGRGMGAWMGGRGLVGMVTEIAPDHYTVKSQAGETYIVHYSANTRFVKQPAQRMAPGQMRTPPQPLKAEDIRVGDAIMAEGEVDPAAKSVGAVMVVKIDPARAREMREMEANFGKTWLAGKVTAVNETKVTLDSPMDHTAHTFVADENTTFRRRREPITLADVQAGDNVRVEGAVKDGVFTASSVVVMGPPATGAPMPPHDKTPE